MNGTVIDQTGNLTYPQLNANGSIITDLQDYSYFHISTQDSITIKEGRGTLGGVTINTVANGGTITIYDGTDNTGNIIAIITSPGTFLPVTLTFNILFNDGLHIVTADATQDITIRYH